MAFFVKGHDESNDEVFGQTPQNGRSATDGYIDGGAVDNSGYSGRYHDARAWGGERGQIVNGYLQPGTSGADKDVSRYRDLGAQRTAPVRLDQGQASQARGLQMGALALLRNAARGEAPSRAAIVGRMQSEQVARDALASTGGGRGGGQSVMAMRNAMAATANRQGAISGQAVDARAAESLQDVGAYYGGASAIRGQDVSAATTNAQLEAAQRDVDERRQQGYEKLAWDTRNAELFAGNEAAANDRANELAHRKLRAAEEQADYEKAKDLASIGLGLGSGMIAASGSSGGGGSGSSPKPDPSLPVRDDPYATSDERSKRNVVPMGSLARLMTRR